jgi:hypothetical protein
VIEGLDELISTKLLTLTVAEMKRAHEKHGPDSMLSPGKDRGTRLAILMEEVGEVARAMTYDEGDDENLHDELVQVAAMALSWLHAEEAEHVCPKCYRDLRTVDPSVAEYKSAVDPAKSWRQVACHCGHVLERTGPVPE